MSPDSLVVDGDSGMKPDSRTALRMLRLSFPQKASMRGSSPPMNMSSCGPGLSSTGELGAQLRSSGALVEVGGGEKNPEDGVPPLGELGGGEADGPAFPVHRLPQHLPPHLQALYYGSRGHGEAGRHLQEALHLHP